MPNLFYKYDSHPSGLSSSEATIRLTKYGSNQLKAQKRRSLILEFLDEFKDLMVLILIGATIFAFVSGETTDAIVIMVVVLLNAAIGFGQKYKAEKAIEALRKMVKPYARVLRNGEQHKIPAEQIVPGDILILEEGDSIAADAILYETNELETQEAILTGESMPVEKHLEQLVYMGTTTTHGTGHAIVVKTGMQTEMGKIATLTTETKKDKSPLEKEIQKIGVFVGKITLVISAILFVVGYFIQGRELVDTLIFATAVAVAAVPEGLPATITISLAIGVQRMAKKNAIIKQLSSVETLGATTVICTDKTGTLTKNEMTVKEIDFSDYQGQISGTGYEPFGALHLQSEKRQDVVLGTIKTPDPEKLSTLKLGTVQKQHPDLYSELEQFMLIAGLCNNAEIVNEGKSYKALGDPTEAALISLVEKSGFKIKDLKKKYQKVHEFPFDSTRKRMTVIIREKSSGKYFALTKGAPGSILQACSTMLFQNSHRDLTETYKKDIENRYQLMAKKAYRCLSMAIRPLTSREISTIEKHAADKSAQGSFPFKLGQIEHSFTYIGLLGMLDPPRPEVAEAIELTRKAGIRVYIVTGDYGLTAEAIGRQIGLIKGNDHLIVHGDGLSGMTDKELQKLLSNKKRQIIFARVSPEHKLRIVSALKRLDEIVAVTGDGVNDAPALKKADIGVAMGISGTDVSKEAANMVLSDDSFSSIVAAVKEGRTIYENLRKFIFYVFSSNIGEIFLIFFAIILGLPAPLSAVLILFINLTTDVFPAVALGVEPAEQDVMNKKPRSPSAKILNAGFVKRILFNGAIIGTLSFAGFFFEMWRHGILWQPLTEANMVGYAVATSLSFLLMVTIELANALSARSEDKSIFKIPLFSNLSLLMSLLFSFLIAIIILEVPYLEQYFKTTHMGHLEWIIMVAACIFLLVAEEIRKAVKRAKNATSQL